MFMVALVYIDPITERQIKLYSKTCRQNTVHAMNYAYGSQFAMLCYGQVLTDFTHIIQYCFTDTGWP